MEIDKSGGVGGMEQETSELDGHIRMLCHWASAVFASWGVGADACYMRELAFSPKD